MSQTAATGAGTVVDPIKVTTVVDLGGSGIRLTQTDAYITGRESYVTTVSLTNAGSVADAIVYRAGDCYVANSDFGKGVLTPDQVACVADAGRVAQWVPLTGTAHGYEARYADVWSRIGAQQPFPDTCRCDEHIDNGAGLSWQVRIGGGATIRVSHLTAFAAEHRDSDRDGDGLLDAWETEGLDINGDGTVDVDLPAMGASPDHKDVFVEVDWMEKTGGCVWFACWGFRSFAPNPDALADVRAAFNDAPVTNPDGHNGIRLHIDAGPSSVMNPVTGATWGNRSLSNRVDYDEVLGSVSGDTYDWTDFNALQTRNFQSARADVFHYAIYGDRFNGTSSGIARVDPDSRFAGDAFLVTSGGWSSGFSRREEAGTFMHELGHTLGLHHGGGNDLNYKPNYLSIMSYTWQMGHRTLDYSQGALPSLNESSLNEAVGVPGTNDVIAYYCSDRESARREVDMQAPVDWNCDGDTNDTGVSRDVNRDGRRDTLAGYDDWSHIIYDGGAVGAFGASDLNDQNPPPTTSRADEATLAELRAADAAGEPGDGAVRWAGPTVVFAGVDGQKLFLDVSNEGRGNASFVVKIDGLPGAGGPPTIAVAGYATQRIEVPLDATGLRAGTYQVTVVLTRPGNASPIARDAVQVRVPDLNDPTTRNQATAAVGSLNTPHNGLDESVRTSILTALRTALTGGGPSPTASSPAATQSTSATAAPAPGRGHASGGLPTTGANVVAVAGAGLGLVLVGVVLLLLIRRRRRIRFDV